MKTGWLAIPALAMAGCCAANPARSDGARHVSDTAAAGAVALSRCLDGGAGAAEACDMARFAFDDIKKTGDAMKGGSDGGAQ